VAYGSVTLNSGSGGELVATDEVASKVYQLVKLVGGGEGTITELAVGNGTNANSLRVTIASDTTGVLSVDDNGGSITVDGTVTANLSATDNAVLDSIQAAVELLDNAVSGNELQVDVVTLPSLPAGTNNIGDVDVATVPAPLSTTGGGTEAAALRVTVANNSTGVLSVDDGGGTLTVDGTVTANVGTGTQPVSGTVTANAGTGPFPVSDNGGSLTIDGTVTANLSATDNAVLDNIQTAVQLIDNVVSGSEAQVDVITQPARVHTTDRMSVALDSSVVMDGTTAMTPGFDSINVATSGNNTLLAAQGAGNKIRVLSLFLVSAGVVNVRFESGANGTALSGQMPLVANTGFVLPFNPAGWFETADNTLLNLELSAAVSVDGAYSYVVV